MSERDECCAAEKVKCPPPQRDEALEEMGDKERVLRAQDLMRQAHKELKRVGKRGELSLPLVMTALAGLFKDMDMITEILSIGAHSPCSGDLAVMYEECPVCFDLIFCKAMVTGTRHAKKYEWASLRCGHRLCRTCKLEHKASRRACPLCSKDSSSDE